MHEQKSQKHFPRFLCSSCSWSVPLMHVTPCRYLEAAGKPRVRAGSWVLFLGFPEMGTTGNTASTEGQAAADSGFRQDPPGALPGTLIPPLRASACSRRQVRGSWALGTSTEPGGTKGKQLMMGSFTGVCQRQEEKQNEGGNFVFKPLLQFPGKTTLFSAVKGLIPLTTSPPPSQSMFQK